FAMALWLARQDSSHVGPWDGPGPVERSNRSTMQELFADRPDVFAPASMMPADAYFQTWGENSRPGRNRCGALGNGRLTGRANRLRIQERFVIGPPRNMMKQVRKPSAPSGGPNLCSVP